MEKMRDTVNMEGVVFDVQRFSVHDGPGIRTTIFLKGCPMRCLWCHNPESQRKQPELSFERELCILCGSCQKTCPKGAQSIVDGQRFIERALCIGGGECVESCYTNALVPKGRTMTVDAVLEEALRDEILYAKSGGGITLSGGEPTMQPGFALDILKKAKEHGLHTAIETCGFVGWNVLEEIFEVTDLVIYDIKHMDAARHKKLVGVGNALILKNLKALVGRDMLASSGNVDLYTLQKLLTHKSPIMTQRYAHLRDEALKKASNLAGDLINEAVNGKDKVIDLNRKK